MRPYMHICINRLRIYVGMPCDRVVLSSLLITLSIERPVESYVVLDLQWPLDSLTIDRYFLPIATHLRV